MIGIAFNASREHKEYLERKKAARNRTTGATTSRPTSQNLPRAEASNSSPQSPAAPEQMPARTSSSTRTERSTGQETGQEANETTGSVREREQQELQQRAEKSMQKIQHAIRLQEGTETELTQNIIRLKQLAKLKLRSGNEPAAIRDMRKMKQNQKYQGVVSLRIDHLEEQRCELEFLLRDLKLDQTFQADTTMVDDAKATMDKVDKKVRDLLEKTRLTNHSTDTPSLSREELLRELLWEEARDAELELPSSIFLESIPPEHQEPPIIEAQLVLPQGGMVVEDPFMEI